MNNKVDGEWIRKTIERFVDSKKNTLQKGSDETAWGKPLVGFSSGADPLYEFYKRDIGEFHLTPAEFLSHEYQKDKVAPEELTVICWILPQTEATKADHRRETYFPSERWARSRIQGESVNDELRRHVVDALRGVSVEAVAPILSPLWIGATSERYGFASSWSERHAAYASGLGTFGLSDGLITPLGKAMRAGSVIAHVSIAPNERPYSNHHAYCLFYARGTCGSCMKRCPIGAITVNGHDKKLCSKYLDMTKQYVQRHYGFEGYGCGLCQVGVPCESRIPENIEF